MNERNPDFTAAIRLLVITAMLLVISRLMCACAKPVTAPVPVSQNIEHQFYIVYADSQRSAGVTGCTDNGVPIVSLVKELIPSPELLALEAHEFTHVRDMLAFGNCEAYMNAFKVSPDFRLRAESHAYCMELRVGTMVLGWSWNEGLVYFANMLAEGDAYQLHMSTDSVYHYMYAHCKEAG